MAVPPASWIPCTNHHSLKADVLPNVQCELMKWTTSVVGRSSKPTPNLKLSLSLSVSLNLTLSLTLILSLSPSLTFTYKSNQITVEMRTVNTG